MRRFVGKQLLRAQLAPQTMIVPLPRNSAAKSFTTTQFRFKTKNKEKKIYKDEKESRKNELNSRVEAAEEWIEKHDSSRPGTIMGTRASLLEEVDPFELDLLSEKLKEALDKFRKEGAAIKQNRSDPDLIRGLHVELPEDLGGKVRFTDIATIGLKPGDARSLQITVFDTEYTKHIIRAIAQNHPNLNPQPAPKNDMQLLIALPPVTRESRLENQRKVKELVENKKTTVRNIRHDHLRLIKTAFKEDPSLGKDAVTKAEKDVDKEIKSTLEELDKIGEQIKIDIMEA